MDYIGPEPDYGTDLEDELPSPDGSPMVISHGVSRLPARLAEFVTLPAIVTPMHDPQEMWVMSPAECRPPEALADVLVPPADNRRSPGSPAAPAVPTLERNLMFPGQASIGPPSGGATADYRIPTVPRPSCLATVCEPVDGLDTRGEQAHVPDLSREGPFDIYWDRLPSEATPRLSQDSQGCPFRIASYDLEIDGSDFSPEYGVQLHDPRLLEYVGVPESARLLSRSPEYWVQHMGRGKTLSAALQLQHDAGLILSNVQVLQQLVTALNGVSANVMGAVRGRQPFPTHAMQHELRSCQVRRAAHYMTAMGLWRPPVAPGIRGPLPVATCTNCMSCGFPGCATVSREAKFDLLIRTFVVYGFDIPCRLVCWACCL